MEEQLGRGRTLASVLEDEELRGRVADSTHLIADLRCEYPVAGSLGGRPC